MSSLLKQQRALAKLREELEGREGRKCWECWQFGHFAKNCRNKGKRDERKKENRFQVLANKVMQCGVREVRRQEVVEGKMQCFKCEEKGHKKWECSKGRDIKREEEKAPAPEVWSKVREHSGAKGLPPRGAVMSMVGWMTRKEVVTFVECRGCNYKGIKTQENREQGFLGKAQLSNMWYGSCKEAWNWRKEEAKSGRAERVKCSACGGKDAVIGGEMERNEKGEVFCPPCRTGKKVPWWNWGKRLEQSVSRAQKGRAGITDLEKTVQKGQREVRRTLRGL